MRAGSFFLIWESVRVQILIISHGRNDPILDAGGRGADEFFFFWRVFGSVGATRRIAATFNASKVQPT